MTLPVLMTWIFILDETTQVSIGKNRFFQKRVSPMSDPWSDGDTRPPIYGTYLFQIFDEQGRDLAGAALSIVAKTRDEAFDLAERVLKEGFYLKAKGK